MFGSASVATRAEEEIKGELKWLTASLTPAREIDIFCKKNGIRPIVAHAVPRRGGHAVKKDVSIKRAEAFNTAKKAVASERFRLLLISLLEWVENKQTYCRGHGMAIEKYATDQLRRRLKKVSRDGREFEQLSARPRAAQNPYPR